MFLQLNSQLADGICIAALSMGNEFLNFAKARKEALIAGPKVKKPLLFRRM